jgi:hypothetical protein
MRNLFQKLLIAGSILLTISFSIQTASACSCAVNRAVDQEFSNYPNVVVLKLQSVEKFPEGEQAMGGGTIKQSKLTVEKVFKGNLKVGQELTFGQGVCCICVWAFSEESVGNSYLFYLSEIPKNGIWTASICSRSGNVKDRIADLLYLKKEKKMRGRTRLSGSLDKVIETPAGKYGNYSYFPLPNRKIRITGNGKNTEIVTDENGVYEIYDLPAGKYKIIPEKLSGFVFQSDESDFGEFEIRAKSHTEVNFLFQINNAVSGKVVDLSGNPLENVCVDLILTKPENAQDYTKKSCTNKKGEFEITAIPIGTYRIVVNKENVISLREPFPTFYYPNVKTAEEAAEISVDANYFLRDLTLVPPEMIETITLSGTLVYSDGKPAINETVKFLKGAEITDLSLFISSNFDTKTDKNGRFTIKTVKGQAGVLRGTTYSFVGEFLNCPALDEILKRKGDKVSEIDTEDVEIDATENLFEIELKFPFPSCKKAKID